MFLDGLMCFTKVVVLQGQICKLCCVSPITAVYDGNSKLQMAGGSFSFSTQHSGVTFIYPGNETTWPFLIMTWLGGLFIWRLSKPSMDETKKKVKGNVQLVICPCDDVNAR